MALVMMPGGEMQDLARRYANTVRRAAPSRRRARRAAPASRATGPALLGLDMRLVAALPVRTRRDCPRDGACAPPAWSQGAPARGGGGCGRAGQSRPASGRQQMRRAVGRGRAQATRADMAEAWRGGLTRLEKLRGSLAARLPAAWPPRIADQFLRNLCGNVAAAWDAYAPAPVRRGPTPRLGIW